MEYDVAGEKGGAATNTEKLVTVTNYQSFIKIKEALSLDLQRLDETLIARKVVQILYILLTFKTV